jgi:polyhydroxyalkanoate synthesis regulator phasin
MENTFTKGVYTGIGLLLKTKERVEEVANKIAEESKLGEEEGKKFVDNLKKESDEARVEFEKKVEEKVEEAMKRIGLARDEEVQKLKVKISELEVDLKNLKAEGKK